MRGRLALCLVAVVLLSSVVGCCCCNTSAVQEIANRGISAAKMQMIVNALKAHADDNGGVWPDDLEAVKDSIADFDETMKNPLTGASPGYEYVKPAEGADPATTVVLYQLRDGARDESVEMGYADGTVRASTTPAP